MSGVFPTLTSTYLLFYKDVISKANLQVNWIVEKLIQYWVHWFDLLIIFQVTTYDSFRYNWRPRMDFQQKHITSKVKGKHGIQLLVEIERSLFRKNVFGCICIGTYVRIILIYNFKYFTRGKCTAKQEKVSLKVLIFFYNIFHNIKLIDMLMVSIIKL